MIPRLAAALALAGGLVAWTAAPAQQSAVNPMASGTPPAVTVYEDRLIDSGSLAPDEAETEAPYNAEGWPRFWRVEGVASYFEQQGVITRENGARLSGRLDTPNYGAFSLDATVRVDPGSFIATLIQRDFAFDTRWRVNNGLGVVSSLGIDLTRSQYRFFIPTFPTIGGNTEWLRDNELQLQASAGRPGNYDGFRLTGFESLGGSIATVGAQWNISPQWQAGIQLVDARDVQSEYAAGNGTGDGTVGSKGAYASLAWNNATTRLQGNFLASDASSDGQSVRANGLWLDGRTLWAGVTHNYGVFRLEPGLAWGYQPINNDIQGAYYRFSYQSLRWQFDGGVDRVTSVSGRGDSGWFYTINGRYQATVRTGVGGNLGYLSSAGRNAWLASIYGDQVWSLGTSRLQVSAAYNDATPRTDAQQISLDHTWNMPAGSRLTTSLTATRDHTGSTTSGQATIPDISFRRYGIGVLGGGDITNNLSIDANLQYNVVTRDGSASGVYGNVNLVWRLSPAWSVLATFYDSTDDTAKIFAFNDPLIPVIDPVPTQRNRSIFLMLRYETRAGSPVLAAGARPGMPLGGIAGVIFLDVNDNGRRDPGEPGAANVTVLLDGRFSTRTDEAGRFEFPFVGVGGHRISVLPDNLPLPWTLGDARHEIRVDPRETTNIELGARRLR